MVPSLANVPGRPAGCGVAGARCPDPSALCRHVPASNATPRIDRELQRRGPAGTDRGFLGVTFLGVTSLGVTSLRYRPVMTDAAHDSLERQDLLRALTTHRGFLRQTVRGLNDAQARRTTTASALCLGGLIKHVSLVEEGWASFIVDGPSTLPSMDPAAMRAYAEGFQMLGGDTLAGLLERYAAVAARTDELVASLASLDAAHPLPEAPWFEPGATWSARMALLHVVAETAQHAGHADIIRESLDGAKTMG